MLNSVERLEKVLFSGGTFSVKNVVTLGQKSGTGNRLDPIYTRQYNSTKYNDRNALEVVRFNQSEYIVFAVNNFEAKVNEEVFISYPHMQGLISFLEECYELVNTQGVYTNNSVAAKYNDTAIESEKFASGKSMIAVPAVWDGNDNNIRKGILLFLSSEDICVQLDIAAISSLCYILSNFNLSLESNQLLIMGMLNELGRGGIGGGASSSPFKSNNTQTGAQTGAGAAGKKRGLFGNGSGGSRRPLGSGTSTPAETGGPSENEGEDIPDEQTPPPATTGRKKLSMDNIMDSAKEINVEDLGSVEI
jgi:hypothetical protein